MKKIITSILCCILIMSVFQVVPEATAFNSVENSISIEKSVVILASVCYQDGELYGIREGSGCFVGAQESECRYILTSSFVTEGYSDWPEDSVKGLFLFIDDEPVLINEKNIKLISEDDDLVLITLPEPIQSGMNLVIDHNVEVKDGDIVYVVGYDGNTITATKEEVKDSFVYQNTVEFYHATTNIALEQWGSPVVTEEGRMVGLCAGAYYDDNQDQVSLNIGSIDKTFTLKDNMMALDDDNYIQTWYGEYKLPNTTIAVKHGDSIDKPLTNGYIAIKFDIEAEDASINEKISYSLNNRSLNGAKNTTQWDYEGYLGFSNPTQEVTQDSSLRLQLEDGIWIIDNQDKYSFVKGTVILYDADARAADDIQ